jgi:MFS transporter, MHS family, shikimate and dehydroshikimate transport protein
MGITTASATVRNRRRVSLIAAGSVGSVLEYYDFWLYSTMAALILGKLFFPKGDVFVASAAALTTVAIGYIARPIGGILFGHIGDRIGRRTTLTFTLVIVGVTSVAIGALPTYAQVGAIASILLICMQLIQGLAKGGEWAGSTLLLFESSPVRWRGFFASFTQAGISTGYVLASGAAGLMTLITTPQQFETWGWRVPFLVSLAVMAAGLIVRLRVPETPEFVEAAGAQPRQPRPPILDVLRRDWRTVLLLFAARVGDEAGGSVFTPFMIVYGTLILHLSASFLLFSLLLSFALEAVTFPLFGALSDRIGRRAVVIGGVVSLAVFVFPFFALINTRIPGLILVALCIGRALIYPAMAGPQPVLYSELFGTLRRYSGVGLAFNLGTMFGAIAPVILTGVLAATHTPWVVAGIVVAACAVAIPAWWTVTQPHRLQAQGGSAA